MANKRIKNRIKPHAMVKANANKQSRKSIYIWNLFEQNKKIINLLISLFEILLKCDLFFILIIILPGFYSNFVLYRFFVYLSNLILYRFFLYFPEWLLYS